MSSSELAGRLVLPAFVCWRCEWSAAFDQEKLNVKGKI